MPALVLPVPKSRVGDMELDRLGVFKEYADRFLDLFKKAS
jgi:hypothetical protein